MNQESLQQERRGSDGHHCLILFYSFYAEWTQKHQRQLGKYVQQCLEKAKHMEFFSCWNRDETLLVDKHRWITLHDFLAPEFYFDERQLTIVYKDQNSLQAAMGGIHSVDSDR